MNFKNISSKSIAFTIIIFFIVLILGIFIFFELKGRNFVKNNNGQTTMSPTLEVKNFYDWYMKYRGDPISNGAYKSITQLSTLFVNEIDNRYFKGTLTYDPFVCNYPKPLGVDVVSEEIKDNKAKVIINTDYGVEKLVSVNLVLEGSEWKISSIECPQIEEQKQKELEKTKNRVSLFLINKQLNKEGDNECTTVHKVERIVEPTGDNMVLAIRELLKGINKAEEIQGYTSTFSAKTADMLKGVQITTTKITVSFVNYKDLTKDMSECEKQLFETQLKQTIKQYIGNQDIVFE